MSTTAVREDNVCSHVSTPMEFSSIPGSVQNSSSDSLLFQRKLESKVCRLQTYEKWPLKFIKKESLAAAGFYYLNEDDRVECVYCKLVLGNFVEGDDPMRDHIRWSPHCPYVKAVNAAKGNLDLVKVERANDTCGIYPLELRPYSRPEKGSPDQMGLENRPLPKYPFYACFQYRLKSFDKCPKSLIPRPKKLAEAGFFYSGRSDETCCFYCGWCLKDWKSKDDPWVEHWKCYKECLHLVLNKGNDFVESLSSEEETLIPCQEINKMNDLQLVNQVNEFLHINDPKETSLLQSEEKSGVDSSSSGNSSPVLDEGQLGKVCSQEEIRVVNLPCSHLVTYAKCAPPLKTCPVCGEKLTAVVRVYMK